MECIISQFLLFYMIQNVLTLSGFLLLTYQDVFHEIMTELLKKILRVTFFLIKLYPAIGFVDIDEQNPNDSVMTGPLLKILNYLLMS